MLRPGLTLSLLFLICAVSFAQEKQNIHFDQYDVDGDHVKDKIWFDYSNGEHCCYTVHIKTTHDSSEYFYPFQVDGGYYQSLDKSTPDHFKIGDFDHDGMDELFMEIATSNGRMQTIPDSWTEKYGVESNHIMLDYNVGTDSIEIVNEPWVISPDYYFEVRDKTPDEIVLRTFSEGNLFGFKDQNGNVVFEPRWHQVGPFNQNHVAMVRHFQRTWLIDSRGEIIDELDHMYVLNNFVSSGGNFLVFDGIGGYYFMNSSGDLINHEPIKGAKPHSEGLAAIKDSETGLWGYVDPFLNWVILPKFKDAHPFRNGKAYVRIEEGAGGFIDRNGNLLDLKDK